MTRHADKDPVVSQDRRTSGIRRYFAQQRRQNLEILLSIPEDQRTEVDLRRIDAARRLTEQDQVPDVLTHIDDLP